MPEPVTVALGALAALAALALVAPKQDAVQPGPPRGGGRSTVPATPHLPPAPNVGQEGSITVNPDGSVTIVPEPIAIPGSPEQAYVPPSIFVPEPIKLPDLHLPYIPDTLVPIYGPETEFPPQVYPTEWSIAIEGRADVGPWIVEPGERLRVTLYVSNTGPLPVNYYALLQWVGAQAVGQALDASDAVAASVASVPPGMAMIATFDMTAPQTRGPYAVSLYIEANGFTQKSTFPLHPSQYDLFVWHFGG